MWIVIITYRVKKDILHRMCEQLHISNAKIAQFHYHFHVVLQG